MPEHRFQMCCLLPNAGPMISQICNEAPGRSSTQVYTAASWRKDETIETFDLEYTQNIVIHKLLHGNLRFSILLV